jgi:hypothetical protein
VDDGEREAILQALRDHHAALRAESDRHEAFVQQSRAELYELLARGKEAGIGRKQMSKAAGLSLPSLSRLLDSPSVGEE